MATTPAQLRAVARRVFRRGPLLTRLLQHHRPTICPFHDMLDHVPEGARILDIGCGGGLLLALISATRRPAKLVGFDSSARAIGMAHQNLDGFGEPRPELLLLDVNAPWPPGGFDVVVLCDVLHHVPKNRQESLLRRAAEAVTPGGILLYKDIYPEGWIRPNASRLHDLVIAHEPFPSPRSPT